jgi:hypothetical protein
MKGRWPISTPCEPANALVVEGERPPVGLFVVGDHDAAVAGGDGLIDVEAEASCRSDGTHRLAPVGRSRRLAAVLDQQQPVRVRDCFQLFQARGVAEHVHSENGLRARSDLTFDVARVKVRVRSTSASTGTARLNTSGHAGMNVYPGTMTSSPGPTFSAARAARAPTCRS